MYFSVVILIVMCAGSACRWVAYRDRVLFPRHYVIGSFRWWFPPFPIDGEFSTTRSCTLEVTGRILTSVVAAMIVANILLSEIGRS